jgi:hypothetical protein
VLASARMRSIGSPVVAPQIDLGLPSRSPARWQPAVVSRSMGRGGCFQEVTATGFRTTPSGMRQPAA